jgi:hypothetical protein
MMKGKFGFSFADFCSRVSMRRVMRVFQTPQRRASQERIGYNIRQEVDPHE